MASASIAPAQLNLLPSEIDLALQRRQMWLVGLAFAIYMLGSPFVTYVHVTSLEQRSSDGGMHIRLHALAYGLPLLAAFFSSNRFRGFRVTFAGSRMLDNLALISLLYWAGEAVHGLAAGNPPKYVLSNGFNFSVPILCYFAMRNLDYPGVVDQLSRVFAQICVISILPNAYVTYYAAVHQEFVGAGGASHLLPVAVACAALLQGRHLFGLLALAGALVTILASLKRAVWCGTILLPIAYLYVIERTRHLLTFAVAGAMLIAVMLVFEDHLPERLSIDAFSSRVSSIHQETQGFTSGQARQDEVYGIWERVVEDGSWLNVLFGRGVGASYTYYMSTTHKIVIYDYRNSHFTPFGWLLRGGFVGMFLNLTFYGVACVLALVSAREANATDRIWLGAWTAYFMIALLLSASSFNLTPNPATHLVLMAVLMRGASQRRLNAFGEDPL